MITKHNDRSIRKPCRTCKRQEWLYWGHDSSRGSDYCAKCSDRDGTTVTGRWVLVERNGVIHSCFAGDVDQASDQTPDAPEDAPEAPAMAPLSAPSPSVPAFAGVQPAAANGHASDQAAQLVSLIQGMARGSVDEAQVDAMITAKLGQFGQDLIDSAGRVVSDKLASLTVPTVVEIRRPDADPKVIHGAHKALPMILAAAQVDNVLMVGPMGTGKSTIAEHVAQALDRPFSMLSVGPQTSESKILGYMTADGTYVPSLFRIAYESGHVWLFDEMDAAHPGVFTIVNAALANGHMAFPDGMVRKHADTLIMAAANTYGRGPDRMYVGRQALDAATLDRFSIVEVQVDEALETAMAYSTGLDTAKCDEVLAYVRKLRSNAEANKMAVGFSPRASFKTCALITAGWSVRDAVNSRIRKGLSDQDWRKVTEGSVTPRA